MAGALRRAESLRPPDRDDESANNAGGHVFTVSEKARLNRFLTLGTEGGTYYADEKTLTKASSDLVVKLARENRPMLISNTVAVSTAGRAPRNSPALFALAAAGGLGNQDYRAKALGKLPDVARTGGHLLEWAAYHELFRGWGPQAVRYLRKWYAGKEPAEAAFQVMKYKQRGGWSQRDLIRLVHLGYGGLPDSVPGFPHRASPDSHLGDKGTEAHQALWRYLSSGKLSPEVAEFAVVQAAHAAHETRNVEQWVTLLRGCKQLSREMLPSEALREPLVWQAMIEGQNLGYTAILRNLANMTRCGLLRDGRDEWTSSFAARLADPGWLKKARVHPVAVLLAMRAYGLGRPAKGKGGSWAPSQAVLNGLNDAFYAAFGAVEPSGKRIINATDTSGSMTWEIAGYPFTAAEAVAAMAMVTQRTEPFSELYAFATTLRKLPVADTDRLDTVMRVITSSWGGSTDCAAPMTWARKNHVEADVFRVYTDNETWYGPVHPHRALEQYRQVTGIDARLEVVAVAPTEFSIADPLDPRQLDVSGFDSAVPQLLADHARGDL